jgi:hypothetical protein
MTGEAFFELIDVNQETQKIIAHQPQRSTAHSNHGNIPLSP